MKYFSLFSGIGGFEYGIDVASTKRLQQGRNNKDLSGTKRSQFSSKPFCIGYSEIDKYANSIYKKHFPEHKEYGDVSKIKWNDVEGFDLLCAGFPCQSFSIAGKRGGFCDTRGTLFFQIARCIKEKLPRLILLENVKGLLSHDKGKTFGVILNTLDELGYDLQWQVLNSKNFGVPQNRERVFIVGHLRGTSRPEVFPIGESSNFHKEPNKNKQREKKFASTVRPGLSGLPGNSETYIKCYDDYNHKMRKDNLCGTVRPTFNNDAPGNGCKLLTGTKIRRLTPTECERLQGFPDGWTEGVSDTQRYKCLGNAVTTNVVSAIMEKLF